MKQTAVEWLVQVVQSCIAPDYIPKEIVEQAKATEKEQIINAYHINPLESKWKNIGEQYYNETFKSE